MKKLFNQGFTLIELLVVIAIIGILSSIVLASLSSARTKGEDAAIQSTLSNMRAQAELFYANNSNYGVATTHATPFACGSAAPAATTLFTSSTGLTTLVAGLLARQTVANGTACKGDATSWVVASQLKTAGQTYCVDSLGTSKQGTYASALLAINSTTNACN